MSLAQRLVRKLCSSCKTKKEISSSELSQEFIKEHDIAFHYNPVGCNQCHFTGYRGRIAIYEVIPITKELQSSIKHNKLQIDDYIVREKIATLKSNAIKLVKNGTTSIEEVYSLLKN